jgi:hypothetical protein
MKSSVIAALLAGASANKEMDIVSGLLKETVGRHGLSVS